MDQKNKQQVPKEEPKASVPENTAARQKTGWKKLLTKKWVFPAAYVAAAAIILSIMWVYQGSSQTSLTDQDLGLTDLVEQSQIGQEDQALPVTAPTESLRWPVADMNAVEQVMGYYDQDGDQTSKAAAMIQNGNTFTPSLGISLARPDNQSFEVLAAMSGTVTRVKELPLVGHIVEITHEDGLRTIYQSLANIRVEENDQISQGMVIADAGRNELEKEQGVHVHFQVFQNDVPVNPQDLVMNSATGDNSGVGLTPGANLNDPSATGEMSSNTDTSTDDAEGTDDAKNQQKSNEDQRGDVSDDQADDPTNGQVNPTGDAADSSVTDAVSG